MSNRTEQLISPAHKSYPFFITSAALYNEPADDGPSLEAMQTWFTFTDAWTASCLVISASDVAVTRNLLLALEAVLRATVTSTRIA